MFLYVEPKQHIGSNSNNRITIKYTLAFKHAVKIVGDVEVFISYKFSYINVYKKNI